MALQNATIFHGSGVVVEEPEIRKSKFTKDFGYGFYCTHIYSQSERWALKHDDAKKGEIPTVNMYLYRPNPELNYKVFEEMTEEWLDFIVLCRRSEAETPHDFDIVEGPMADDQVWDHIEDFLSGKITRKAFWALVEFKHPTHQITFHTAKALECLTFEKAVTVQ